MIRVALTGNIASGKSAVENILAEKYNIKVLDTDEVCHRLLDELPEIKEAFAKFDILGENGKISRDKLGRIVFFSPELKKCLEDILYPCVQTEINKFFEANKDETAVFIAIPLLFESGMEKIFDKIIFVYCNDDIRLERLITRNCYTAEYAQKRISAQLPQEYKLQKSDIIINNSSDFANLETETANAVEKLMQQNCG